MLKHTVSSVFIFSKIQGEWKILLINHKKLKKWVIPGGHIEDNESPIEAARREAFEETSIKDLDFISFIHKKYENFSDSLWDLPPEYCYIETIPENKKDKEHKHIDFLYIAISKNTNVVINDYETTGIQWFSAEEIEGLNAFEMTKKFSEQIFECLNNRVVPAYGNVLDL